MTLAFALLLLCTCLYVPGGGVLLGGWRTISTDDKDVQAAATFAADNMLQDDDSQEPVEVESAEMQIVEGVQYRLKLKLKDKTRCSVDVWYRSWLEEPDRMKVDSWKCDD